MGYTFLNKFDARFILSKMQDYVDNVDTNSIIGSEATIRVQRRFEPQLNQSVSYTINYNVPLHRGTLTNKLTSTQFTVFDITGVIRTAQLEEIPQSFTVYLQFKLQILEQDTQPHQQLQLMVME